MIQALIRVPSSTNWSPKSEKDIKAIQVTKKDPRDLKARLYDKNISDDAMRKIHDSRGASPDHNDVLFGTRIFKGYKLYNYVAETNFYGLQEMITNNGLDWKILAYNIDGVPIRGYKVTDVLPFMQSVKKYNKDGKLLSTIRPTKVTQFGGFQGLPKLLSVSELNSYNKEKNEFN